MTLYFICKKLQSLHTLLTNFDTFFTTLEDTDSQISKDLISYHIKHKNSINNALSVCNKYLQMQLNDQNRLIQMVLVPLYYQKLKEMKINSILHEELLVMIFSFLAIDPDRLTTEPELYGSWAKNKSYINNGCFTLTSKELIIPIPLILTIIEITNKIPYVSYFSHLFMNKFFEDMYGIYAIEYSNKFESYKKLNVNMSHIFTKISKYEPYHTLSKSIYSQCYNFNLNNKTINALLHSISEFSILQKLQHTEVYLKNMRLNMH